MERQMHRYGEWRCIVTCPKCGSGNEMLFSALSVSFVCNEAPCGFELEVDPETAEVLLQPEVELTFA